MVRTLTLYSVRFVHFIRCRAAFESVALPLAEGIVKQVAASYFDSTTNTSLKVEESMVENRTQVTLVKTYTTSVVEEIRQHSSIFTESAADHKWLDERLEAAVLSLESTKRALNSTAVGVISAVEKVMKAMAEQQQELLEQQQAVTKMQEQLTDLVKAAEGVAGPSSFKNIHSIASWLVRQHSFMMKFVTTLCTCPRACDASNVACRTPVLSSEVASILAQLPPYLRGETVAGEGSTEQQEQDQIAAIAKLEAMAADAVVDRSGAAVDSSSAAVCVPHGVSGSPVLKQQRNNRSE